VNSTPQWRARRAVVTGASRGIGRAIVQAFLERGAHVIAAARKPDELASFERDCNAPDRLATVSADVATSPGREAIRTLVASRWGVADVLVNNVGTNIRKPSLDYSDAEARTIIDTNLISAYELSRAMHPLLIAGNSPAIVNVSSIGSTMFIGSGVVYAMTKAAIDQMTRYLAVEWAPRRADSPPRQGVRVNAVCPWYIRTPLVEPVLSNPERLRMILDRTPMGRVGEPEEVAEAVAFFAGPGASFITGQCLVVDGGMSCKGL